MAAASPIPCCENILGARHGEGRITKDELVSQSREEQFEDQRRRFQPPPINDLNGRINFCSDGIQLHRPLLSFSKSRILRTCEEHGLEYVNDKTNYNPQLTTRNSIRFLRSHYELPRALSGQRILDLQKNSREKLDLLRQKASAILGALRVSSFDLRSGSMTVQLPKKPETLCKGDPMAVAYVLGLLLQPVSPAASKDQSTIVRRELVNGMFPQFENLSRSKRRPPSTLTDRRVFLQHQVELDDVRSEFTTWRLSRQPLRSCEIENLQIPFAPDSNTGFSRWLFWDRRYWIRIQCLNAEAINSFVVRPYTKVDAIDVYDQFHGVSGSLTSTYRRFKEALNDAAPGTTRYTLPVLADGHKVLAFPTLDIATLNGTLAGGPAVGSLLRGWEVRYKSINKELRESGCFSAIPVEERRNIRNS
jgi:PP-loop family